MAQKFKIEHLGNNEWQATRIGNAKGEVVEGGGVPEMKPPSGEPKKKEHPQMNKDLLTALGEPKTLRKRKKSRRPKAGKQPKAGRQLTMQELLKQGVQRRRQAVAGRQKTQKAKKGGKRHRRTKKTTHRRRTRKR